MGQAKSKGHYEQDVGMTNFFIEFRLHGYAKDYAKELIYDVAKKFGVKGVTKRRAVPHIALYGHSETDNMKRVVSEVEKIGRKYTLVPFKIKGFDYFNKEHKVIYLDINPSPELKELRWELAQRLSKISTPLPKDMHRKFQFHATVAFKDIDRKFNKIWSYIKAKEEPNINQHLLRITILGANRKILYEYDLVLKKLLTRGQALSKYWWNKTITKFRELQGLPQEKRQSAFVRFIRFIKNLFTA